jgi:hypothetical protein
MFAAGNPYYCLKEILGVFKLLLFNNASSAAAQIPLSQKMLGLNPRTVAMFPMGVRRINQSAISHPLYSCWLTDMTVLLVPAACW